MLLEETVNEINKRLLSLKDKKKVVVWGVAEAAVRLFQYTEISKYNVSDIVDNGKAGMDFFGKKIRNPKEINWQEIDAVVVGALYRTYEIIEELKGKYQYMGEVVTLNIPNDNRPFYEHLSLRDLEVPQQYKEIIAQNIKFKDLHKGERVFIIGNGPSIKKTDLTKLKNERTMVLSNFYLHPDYHIIKPDYYVMGGFTNCCDWTENFSIKYVEEIFENSGNTQHIFNYSEKGIIEQCRQFRSKKINYMYMERWGDFHYFDDIDMTKKIMSAASMPIACIQIAIYMGFKEIYLVGVEHDFLFTNEYGYFYDRKQSIIGDKDESVNSINNEVQDSTGVMIDEMYFLWEQYRLVKKIAIKQHVNIYNATIGGKLDVFDRVDYNRMF